MDGIGIGIGIGIDIGIGIGIGSRLLHSISVSVKWLLSQPVSSYCSAKMEMRWKSGGDFNLGQLEFKEKDGKSN